MNTKMLPVHPGEVLQEDFMKPLGLSQKHLAQAMNLYLDTISEILQGKRPITAELALRLSRYFGASPGVWMNLQTHYDLEITKDQFEKQIQEEIEPYQHSA